jgi:hypothetical protein
VFYCYSIQFQLQQGHNRITQLWSFTSYKYL